MLNADIEYKRGILFVRLEGEINDNTLIDLSDNLELIISKAGIKYMVLNVEKGYFGNCSNLDNIISIYKEKLGIDGKLLVCGYADEKSLSKKFNQLYKMSTEWSAFNLINL